MCVTKETADFVNSLTSEDRLLLQATYFGCIRLHEYLCEPAWRPLTEERMAMNLIQNATKGSDYILPGLLGLIEKLLKKSSTKVTVGQIYAEVLREWSVGKHKVAEGRS